MRRNKEVQKMDEYSAYRIARAIVEALQTHDNSKMPAAAGKRRWYGLKRRQAATIVCGGDETLAMLVNMLISDYIVDQSVEWAYMVLEIEHHAPPRPAVNTTRETTVNLLLK